MSFYLNHGEISTHVAWNMNDEIRLNIVQNIPAYQRVSSLVDLATKSVADERVGPATTKLMIELVGIHSFSVSPSLQLGDWQLEIVSVDVRR